MIKEQDHGRSAQPFQGEEAAGGEKNASRSQEALVKGNVVATLAFGMIFVDHPPTLGRIKRVMILSSPTHAP